MSGGFLTRWIPDEQSIPFRQTSIVVTSCRAPVPPHRPCFCAVPCARGNNNGILSYQGPHRRHFCLYRYFAAPTRWSRGSKSAEPSDSCVWISPGLSYSPEPYPQRYLSTGRSWHIPAHRHNFLFNRRVPVFPAQPLATGR